MKEIWKDVVDWEGYYQVSSLGRARSLSRVAYGEKRSFPVTGRVLLLLWKGGYATVRLSDRTRGRDKLIRVHRLVLESFVGPCPSGMEGCHFPDKDTRNNTLGNLKWATHKDNGKHAVDHGSFNGRKHTKETRRIMCITRTGRKLSEETRRKIGASKLGRKRSEETKAKISASRIAMFQARRII